MNGLTNNHAKMTTWLRLCGILLLLLLPLVAFAQSKKDLEEKRKKIIRDIRSTEKMIQKTAKTKEATYDRYVALKRQIESRESLIQTLEAEITAAETGIARNQQVIGSLNNDVNRMREAYGKTVRAAFRRKTLSNPILYMLSAENLNQVFRRWLFLRKYDVRRKVQAQAIRLTLEMLSKKSQVLEDTRTEKENLLVSIQGQKVTLSGELLEKDAMLRDLNKDESRLKSDLESKQAAHEALNSAIEDIIQLDVQKRVNAARSKPAPAPKPAAPEKKAPNKAVSRPTEIRPEAEKPAEGVSKPVSSAEESATLSFRKNKGRLPWPVERGFVSKGYGKQRHPTLKNIEITNNGVDIRTEEGATVRTIADGRVAGIQFVPGHDYTVIIQHGDFYTVYTNLSSTTLNKGDLVGVKHPIGQVSTNPITGTSELHFEVWEQKERMNPSLWIRK